MAIKQLDVIFANGRTVETTLDGGESIGATVLTVDDATSYDAGDLVFISEPGSAGAELEVEFCGSVVSVDGSDIMVDLPLLAAKSDESKVWQPSVQAVLEPVTGRPRVRPDRGLDFTQTLDSVIHKTKVKDTTTFYRVAYRLMSDANYSTLKSFWDNANGADEGISDFVLATYDFEQSLRIVWTVGSTMDLPAFSAGGRGYISMQFDLQKRSEFYPA